MRVSELCSIDKIDIDFTANSVHVKHGKGDKERITYMSPVAAYYINRYFDSREDDYVELFVSSRGSRIKDGGVRWILKDIGTRAEVDNVHPHRFRRTFATRLGNKGMPIQSIQQLMGHEKMDTTMLYVNVDEKAIHAEYLKYMQV